MKKFRMLSSMLAVVMVLSMLTIVPVGAAQLDSNTFFCDFEDFEPGATQTAYNEAGMTVYNADISKTSEPVAIKTETGGNNGVGIGSIPGHLYVAAPSVITTGKVNIGFNIKGSSFAYVKAFFNQPTASYKGKYIASIGTTVAPIKSSGSDGTLATPTERDLNEWSYINIVVDIEADTWTLFLDGKDLGTYKFDADNTAFYGFSLFLGQIKEGLDGMIDNITIVPQVYEDGDGNHVITTLFSETPDVEEGDITVTKCGDAQYSITVESVEAIDHGLKITLGGKLTLGCEYIVTFDGYEDVEIYSYVAPPSNADPSTYPEYFSENFENDITTHTFVDGSTNRTNIVTDVHVKDILESANKMNDNGTELNAVRLIGLGSNLDKYNGESDFNGTQVSGNVLSAYLTGDFYLLDVIGYEGKGIETYEFDYTWNHSTDATMKLNEKTVVTMKAGSKDKKWHHVKLEYDTVNKTLTVTQDGAPSKPLTGIEAMQRLTFNVGNTRNFQFAIDNYQHYVVVSPFNVETVRYTANGVETGANLISPETNKIDITFSGEIDDATVGGITLTADEEVVAFGNPVVNGKVVTLSLPDGLPANADVELTIPTTVKSTTGIALSGVGRVYKVKTARANITIDSLAITDADEIPLPAEGFVAEDTEIKVTASGARATDSTTFALIYALYYDDELVAIGSATKDVTTAQENVSHTFKIAEDVNYNEAKAFAWYGLTTRVPILKAVTAK